MSKMPIQNWHLMEAFSAILFSIHSRAGYSVIRFKQPRWLYAQQYYIFSFIPLSFRPIVLFARDPV
jgi:hypothetical protein